MTVAVLLIDSDLAFIFWLGQALDAAGYSAVPAKNIRAASEVVEEFKLTTELLIIDPSTPGAVSLVLSLREKEPGLKTIAAISPGSQESYAAVFDVVKVKAEHLSAHERFSWIALVQSMVQPNRASGASS